MRNAILAMTATLTLVTGLLHGATQKTHSADVGPGRIAWFDITTTDLRNPGSSTASSSTGVHRP